MNGLIVDYNHISLIVDQHPTDVYVPSLTPAVAGAPGPQGDDGAMIPIREIAATGPSLDLDYEDGRHIVVHLFDHVDFVTFSGWPPSGILARMTLEIDSPGDLRFAWPSEIKWSEGADPSVGVGEYWRAITTRDAGANLRGHIIGNNYQRIAP